MRSIIKESGLLKPIGALNIMQRTAAKIFRLGNLQEALETGGASGSLAPGEDDDDWKYRKLTEKIGDLSPYNHDRMIKVAEFLYDKNPLGARLIEIFRDYLVGDGVRIQAQDEDVHELLNSWIDEMNENPDASLDQKVLELSIYGEQCFPAFVNSVNGEVVLSVLSPRKISAVYKDPDNALITIGVKKRTAPGVKDKVYRTILLPKEEQILSKETKAIREKFTAGNCFYVAINKISTATRGRSDLYRQADMLEGYEQILFDSLDGAALMNAFVWDLLVEGETPEGIEAKKKKLPTLHSGSVYVHNEKEKLTANAPTFNSADQQGIADLFKKHILGTFGLPWHWFSEGGDVNRATAQEMAPPTIKKFLSRQKKVKHFLKNVLSYVIQQAKAKNTIKDGADESFEVSFPPMLPKDMATAATSIQQLAMGLGMLVDDGYLTKETVGRVIAQLIKKFDIEIDPLEEIEKAMAQKDEDIKKRADRAVSMTKKKVATGDEE